MHIKGYIATCFQVGRERPWMVEFTISGDWVMDDTISARLEELRALGADLLRSRYQDVFGSEAQTTDTNYLRRRLAWQMQASAGGDISDTARRRALEIVRHVELNGRVLFGRFKKQKGKRTDRRVPGPGTELTRTYGNRTIVVKILDQGFECDGQHFRSLSAAASAVTGTRWNGLVFFGLAKRGETAKRKRRPTQTKGKQGAGRREADRAA
jgi:hypothetical protein